MKEGKRLVDKVAIVTGGASGIGAETARVFAEHGAFVVLCDVNTALGQSVVSEISKSGGNAIFRALDVTNEQEWTALIAETEEKFGKFNILTNIAGISGRDPKELVQTTPTAGGMLEDQSLDQWNQIMEVNATGTFLGTRHAIAPMRRAGGGSIINISSICGIIGSFANAAYHASKGAVRIFSKAAAIQYAPDRIPCKFDPSRLRRNPYDQTGAFQSRVGTNPPRSDAAGPVRYSERHRFGLPFPRLR